MVIRLCLLCDAFVRQYDGAFIYEGRDISSLQKEFAKEAEYEGSLLTRSDV